MVRVNGEILINRPVEQVLDYVADLCNEPIYNPRMLQSEKITEGPIGVGTRFRATSRSGRRTTEMLIEVTEFQRPRRLGSRTWSWELSPRGALRLLGPLVARLGRRQEQTIWTGLKAQLESGGGRGWSPE
ncbi:MAG TPA: SRPBCC family protein [Propionibacteriaceae bacterium]